MAQVVVIEDEEFLRRALMQVLEREGHQVRGAPNGRLGLDLLKKEPVTLVVTDLFMPEMDGVELVRTVRKQFPSVKIIVISGGAYEGQVQLLGLASGLGAAAVLQKPFELDELVRMVNNVLGEGG